MAQNKHKIAAVIQGLNRGSILWRAVLHSVLLSTLIIVVLSAVSYLFIFELMQRGTFGVEIYDLLSYGAQLGRTLLVVGVVFLSLATVLSFSFGRRLARPFMELRSKIEKIKPGHWQYRRTIRTGDEAEALDEVVSKLTTRLRRIYANLEDIIEERTAKLEEEYAKDRAILHAVHIGIMVIDPKGLVTQVNPATEFLLRMPKKKIEQKHIEDIFPLYKKKKLLPKSEHPVLQCLHQRREVQISPGIHLGVRLHNNIDLPIKISVSPLKKKHRLLGAVMLFQDVTMERQLDYMKSDFITIASHNLRTPLSTIQWYVELLSTENQKMLNAEQKSFLTEMRLATKKMTLVLGELMDASRMSEGGFTPVIGPVDLNAVVGEIMKETEPLIKSKGITYTIKPLGGVAMVRTDPLLASIIIQNLIYNAAKYSREKVESVIDIKLEKIGETIRISVEDNGIGIPYAEQDHIFQKLYRASNARVVQPNGAGLGLYSCQMIADRLGASISFTSKQGSGSTFTVLFPISFPIRKEKTSSTKK